MHYVLDLLFPVRQPTPFVLIVGDCFLWTGAGAVVLAVLARFVWRRGKKLGDL